MTENNVLIEGTEIKYLREGSGRPLVLVHGIGSDCHVWEGLIKELKNHYEIFAITLPTYGTKNVYKHIYSINTYPKVLEEFIKTLQIVRPVLVGHSFGTLINLEFAALHPRSVEKLILIASPLKDQTTKTPLSWKLGLKLALDSKRILRLMEYVGENPRVSWLAQKFMGGDVESNNYTKIFEKWPPQALALCFRDIIKKQFKKIILRMKVPILFICGNHDNVIKKFNGAALYPLAKNKQLVTLEGNHFLPANNAQEIAQLIIKFVG